MQSFQKKINIPTAVKNRSKIDLSQDHYTTNDFFRLKPVYIHECVPTEEIEIKMHTFSRAVALRKPFYGKVEFINRAFFVPMRTIMNNWNEFITDTQQHLENKEFVPFITNSTFVIILCGTQYSVSEQAQPGKHYDFTLQGASHATGYTFTKAGKTAYDILRNLGYHINFYNHSEYENDKKYSALPLLAFYRIYHDWLRNPAWVTSITPTVKYDGETEIDETMLYNMLAKINYGCYEKDYFTSAWKRPSGPNTSAQSSDITFVDVTNDATSNTGSNQKSSVVRSSNSAGTTTPSTPTIQGRTSGDSPLMYPANLSQYSLDRLKQLTDYVKRMQLVGSRALDRFKSLFGIELPAAKLDRSQFLGTHTMTMNVGEVMITADTEEGIAGNYAGRSAGYDTGNIKFKADEFGYIIIISMVRPHIGYAQGRPRFLQHLGRLDFFNPSFDGVGVQPIRMDELFADNFTSCDSSYKPSDVFGFTSQYAEYKTQPHDGLSGDMVLNSRNEGLNYWHLLRLFNPTNLPALNENFTIGNNLDYDRIFNTEDDAYDHFITVYHFDVQAYLPMSKLFEDYDFDGGREINMEIGGTTLT